MLPVKRYCDCLPGDELDKFPRTEMLLHQRGWIHTQPIPARLASRNAWVAGNQCAGRLNFPATYAPRPLRLHPVLVVELQLGALPSDAAFTPSGKYRRTNAGEATAT